MVNFFVILRKIQNPIRVCSGIASTGPSGSDTQFRGEGVGVADPRLNHWSRAKAGLVPRVNLVAGGFWVMGAGVMSRYLQITRLMIASVVHRVYHRVLKKRCPRSERNGVRWGPSKHANNCPPKSLNFTHSVSLRKESATLTASCCIPMWRLVTWSRERLHYVFQRSGEAGNGATRHDFYRGRSFIEIQMYWNRGCRNLLTLARTGPVTILIVRHWARNHASLRVGSWALGSTFWQSLGNITIIICLPAELQCRLITRRRSVIWFQVCARHPVWAVWRSYSLDCLQHS